MTERGAVLMWVTLPCVGYDLLNITNAQSLMFDPARIKYVNTKVLNTMLWMQQDRLKRDEVKVLDLFGVVCARGEFQSTLGPIYGSRPDGIHFTRAAARWVADQLGGDVEKVARQSAERRTRQPRG
jgi:hypothetical protein